MSNGVDFRKLALGLRGQLTAAQSELASLREELARVKGLDHNQLLAESAAQHLIKRGAENYTGEVFTIQLDDSTTKFEVVVSTQKVGAITVYERLADAERRYRGLQKLTPYKFRKIQDASTTDGIDILYFHADRFDALLDAAITKPEEAKS